LSVRTKDRSVQRNTVAHWDLDRPLHIDFGRRRGFFVLRQEREGNEVRAERKTHSRYTRDWFPDHFSSDPDPWK